MRRDIKTEVRRLLCVLQLRICTMSTNSDGRRVLRVGKHFWPKDNASSQK